jgi:hypothetical protein
LEELNQTNASSDKKKDATYKSKIKRVLKEEMGKQSNAWTLC